MTVVSSASLEMLGGRLGSHSDGGGTNGIQGQGVACQPPCTETDLTRRTEKHCVGFRSSP